MSDSRPSHEGWLLGIAAAVGARADCTRRQCGAVIARGLGDVLAVGYNGRPPGLPGCLSEGACPRGRSSVESRSPYLLDGSGYCDAVHAEDSALRTARDRGIDVRGAVMAVGAEPCEPCFVLCRHYGIGSVIWPDGSKEILA